MKKIFIITLIVMLSISSVCLAVEQTNRTSFYKEMRSSENRSLFSRLQNNDEDEISTMSSSITKEEINELFKEDTEVKQVEKKQASFAFEISIQEENEWNNYDYYFAEDDLQNVIDKLATIASYNDEWTIEILKNIDIVNTLEIPVNTNFYIASNNGSSIIYNGDGYAIKNNGELYLGFGNVIFNEEQEDYPEKFTFENGIMAPNGSGILNNGMLEIELGTVNAKDKGIVCNSEGGLIAIDSSNMISEFEYLINEGTEIDLTSLITIKGDLALECTHEHEVDFSSYNVSGIIYYDGIIYSKQSIKFDNIFMPTLEEEPDYYIFREIETVDGYKKYELLGPQIFKEVLPADQKVYVNKEDVVKFYIYQNMSYYSKESGYGYEDYFDVNFEDEYLKNLKFKVDGKEIDNVVWGVRRLDYSDIFPSVPKSIQPMSYAHEYVYLIVCTNLTGDGELSLEIPYQVDVIPNSPGLPGGPSIEEINSIAALSDDGGANAYYELFTGITVDNTKPGKSATLKVNDNDTAELTLTSSDDAVNMWIRTGDGVRILDVPKTNGEGTISVAIPKGFEIAELDDDGKVTDIIPEDEWTTITEKDINDGLVIVAKDTKTGIGNEFVWIPCTTDKAEAEANGLVLYGETLYNLFEFYRAYKISITSNMSISNEQLENDIMTINAPAQTYYEIPEIFKDYKNNFYLTEDEILEAIENIPNENDDEIDKKGLKEFFTEYKEDYGETYSDEGQAYILESVEKYKGFYVGRYEIGTNGRTSIPELSIPGDGPEYEGMPTTNKIANTYNSIDDEIEYYVQPGKAALSYDMYDFFDDHYYYDYGEYIYNNPDGEGYYDYASIASSIHPGLTRILGKYSYNTMLRWLTMNKELDTINTNKILDEEFNNYSYDWLRCRPTASFKNDRFSNIYDLVGNVPEVIDGYIQHIPLPMSLDTPEHSSMDWNKREYNIISNVYEELDTNYYNYDEYTVFSPFTLYMPDYIAPTGLYSMTDENYYSIKEQYDEDDIMPIFAYEPDPAPVGTRAVLYVRELPEWEEFNTTKELEDLPEDLEDIEVYVEDRAGNVSKLDVKIENSEEPEEPTPSTGSSSSRRKNTLRARPDSFSTLTDGELEVTLESLLDNDYSQRDVDIRVADIVEEPKHGKLYKDKEHTEEGINKDGTFYYVPDEGFVGEDSFTYRITDGTYKSEEGEVTIEVKEYELGEEEGKHTWYIRGYEDGTVKPDNNISREEIATIFYRLTTSTDKENFEATEDSFSDVKANRWSNKAIAYLKNKGIIQGYEDGTYKPQNSVTRAEFVTILEKFINVSDETGAKIDFQDVSSTHWADDKITAVVEAGIMQGYEDGTFKPEKAITRAEAMTALNRILNRKLENPEEELNIFPDLSKRHWAYNDIIEATTTHEYERDEDGYELWESYEHPTNIAE